jgi:outer membrane murein-binding lipoprotein Lpp
MPAYEVAEKYPDVYAVTGHYLNLMAPDAVAAGMAYTNDAEGQLNTVDVLNMESDNGDVDTHKPLSASEYRAALTKYIADVKAGKYNDTAVDNAQKRVDELQKKVDALQSSKTADAKDVEAAKQELADAKTQAATERQTINDLYTLLNQQKYR